LAVAAAAKMILTCIRQPWRRAWVVRRRNLGGARELDGLSVVICVYEWRWVVGFVHFCVNMEEDGI
jgi:hypothetical protein